MRRLFFVILILFSSGRALSALPEGLGLADNAKEIYETRVGMRKMVRAFLRSRQCQPKEEEFEDMMGLEYSFGCVFTYLRDWYILFALEDGSHELVHMDEATWAEFSSDYNELIRLKHKRRGFPQFRNHRPKLWFRFTAVAVRPLKLADFEHIIELGREINALEKEYATLLQESQSQDPNLPESSAHPMP